jgi:phosphopantothenoylcysteine decarboxylase/phosphopantothenate--cysteine ligase
MNYQSIKKIMNLQGRKIVLCISGSIAAYKTPELVRQLVKQGAIVKIICTEAATQFVSLLSLSTVSKNEVYSNLSDEASWNNHVHLSRWADVILIAPCSANTLGKMANGLCDNLLCAVYLSAICPILVAPAMDEDMWKHPSTKNNLKRIESFGNSIIPVAHGELASGLIGEGRMADPFDIVQYLSDFFDTKHHLNLKGKNALITAGPTYEKIDPVRFIGNYSTGKMGIALAENLANRGANVTLILGPTHLQCNKPNVNTINVESASEMFEASLNAFQNCDIAILAAAVADYKPKEMAKEKIKKASDTLDIQLVRNKDILAHLGQIKNENQILVGFALETQNEKENAIKKLVSKNADFIILNSLRDAGAGFGSDENKVTIIGKNDSFYELPLQSKTKIADAIIDYITT